MTKKLKLHTMPEGCEELSISVGDVFEVHEVTDHYVFLIIDGMEFSFTLEPDVLRKSYKTWFEEA